MGHTALQTGSHSGVQIVLSNPLSPTRTHMLEVLTRGAVRSVWVNRFAQFYPAFGVNTQQDMAAHDLKKKKNYKFNYELTKK